MNEKGIENNYDKVFPSRLRELMKEHNENQQALATILGKQRQTVSLYITGSSNPDYETLRMIAEHYHVTTDWLVGMPSATKELDIDIAKVCDFTGLSEKAIQNITLGFRKEEYEKLREIFASRYIENEVKPNNVFSPTSYTNISPEEMPLFEEYVKQEFNKGKFFPLRKALNILLESDVLNESLNYISSAIRHAQFLKPKDKVTLVFTDHANTTYGVESLSPQQVVRNELRNAFDGLYESIYSQLQPEGKSYGRETVSSVEELISLLSEGGEGHGNGISKEEQ